MTQTSTHYGTLVFRRHLYLSRLSPVYSGIGGCVCVPWLCARTPSTSCLGVLIYLFLFRQCHRSSVYYQARQVCRLLLSENNGPRFPSVSRRRNRLALSLAGVNDVALRGKYKNAVTKKVILYFLHKPVGFFVVVYIMCLGKFIDPLGYTFLGRAFTSTGDRSRGKE